MDPVSTVASVVTLVGVTLKTVKYVNEMKDASKERQNLSKETADLLPMLTGLRNMIEDPRRSKTSFDGVNSLVTADGPLDQLSEALKQLNKKVKAKRGIKNFPRVLVWPLDKEECKEVLGKIERVKSLISLALEGENHELLQAIKTDTTAGMDTIKEGVAGLQVREDVKEWLEILHWFSPLNFFKTQQDIFARREGDTGQWITQSRDFLDWFAGPKHTLCCAGIPGAGKSVLASIVVDFLRNTTNSDRRRAVAAVFCNFKEFNVQNPENLLASLCVQALDGDVPIPVALQELYKSHEVKRTRPTLREIETVFVEIGKLLDDLYLVIDALDECSADARSFITQKLRTLSSNTKLLATTRPIDDITREFTTEPVLEIRASHADLEKYIKARFERSSRLSAIVQKQPSLETEISDGIIAKANGM
ncbi:MAG: hypothetical protein LQ344_002426 [Seirophora lacunosa]|nr:MAG: hypothetical protein LQ344_002426 [Seirophora lacunosa]